VRASSVLSGLTLKCAGMSVTGALPSVSGRFLRVGLIFERLLAVMLTVLRVSLFLRLGVFHGIHVGVLLSRFATIFLYWSSNMKINVLPLPPEKFLSTWEGRSTERVRQWCELEINGLRNSFQVVVNPGEELQPGPHELSPNSFTIQNGRLGMNRPVLVPVKPAK
jgi:hypothetical protein